LISSELPQFFLVVSTKFGGSSLAAMVGFAHSRASAQIFFVGGRQMLFAVVRRGKRAGTRLVPHRFEDDRYHVSLTRQGPDIPLANPKDIPDYLANGYSLRMSSVERRKPTLISPKSIQGWR
jgi:hypothetical protein